MEKKTIGKFISILRRASGMTQKELGERLYVSDKTVSRWERDECTPELSLIPAIAEIFGITTDELLRGERNAPQTETTQSQKTRSDRQFRTMLHNRMVRFRNLSMISLGIALSAVILAFVINESFFKGVLAFGVGAVMIVAAFVCQFCFASSALLRLEEEDAYAAEIRRANSVIAAQTAGILIVIAAMFAFILPMGLLGGSYYGLSTGTALALGTLAALIMVAVGHIIYVLWIRKALVSRGTIFDEEPEVTAGRRNLLKRSILVLLVVLLVSGSLLAFLMELGPKVLSAQTDRFTDLDEFCVFMWDGAISDWQEDMLEQYGDLAIPAHSGGVFLDLGMDGAYDDYEAPPDFKREQIVDGDGKVLCEYVSAHGFVSDVQYEIDEASGEVTVTVHSIRLESETEQLCSNICTVVLIILALCITIITAMYLLRLRKMKYCR